VRGVSAQDVQEDKALQTLSKANNVFPFVVRSLTTGAKVAGAPPNAAHAPEVYAGPKKLTMTIPSDWDNSRTQAYIATTFPSIRVYRVKVAPPAAPGAPTTTAEVKLDVSVGATSVAQAKDALLQHTCTVPTSAGGSVTLSFSLVPTGVARPADGADERPLVMSIPAVWTEADVTGHLRSVYPSIRVFRAYVKPPAAPTHKFKTAELKLDFAMGREAYATARKTLLQYRADILVAGSSFSLYICKKQPGTSPRLSLPLAT
jgi:hypothetical protein